MAHRIDIAKRRARCVTCHESIRPGEVEMAEQVYDARRLHHLRCAIAAIPEDVAATVATNLAPGIELDREELDRMLAIAREAQRKVRRERYAAALVGDAPAEPMPELRASPQAADGGEVERADLLAQLAEDPEDAGTLAVLADVLQNRGELRGELIAVQLALAAAPTDAVVRRRDELVQQLAPPLAATERCIWGIGFVRGVELVAQQGTRFAELPRLWQHPSMRIAREVRLEVQIPFEAAAVTVALAGIAPRLRRLAIESDQALGLASVTAGVIATMPRLGELVVGHLADAGALAHATLHRLVIAPRVRPVDERDLDLDPARLPALRELVLANTGEATDSLCRKLATRGWLRQLAHLELDGELTTAGIRALADGLDGRKLARLDVHRATLPVGTRAQLAALCDELVFPAATSLDRASFVGHANKPEWGRGRIVRRYDDKVEVEFPGVGRKVFKADAPFLVRSD